MNKCGLIAILQDFTLTVNGIPFEYWVSMTLTQVFHERPEHRLGVHSLTFIGHSYH